MSGAGATAATAGGRVEGGCGRRGAAAQLPTHLRIEGSPSTSSEESAAAGLARGGERARAAATAALDALDAAGAAGAAGATAASAWACTIGLAGEERDS